MKLPNKRWINWDKNFLEEVNEQMLKDKYYKEAMKCIEKNEENLHNTLSQEEGVLYQCARLWVLCGPRTSLLECEYDSKVGSHIGQDQTKEIM
jgi:hypothetical protein